MMYLYHRVPTKDLCGNEIIPLNTLKVIRPDLFEEYMKKYSKRMSVPSQRIIPLDCLWNDVIFLSAVHPQDLLAAVRSLGRNPSRTKFYKIPVNTLDPARMAVWKFESYDKGAEEFVPFTEDSIVKFSKVPNKAIEYWKSRPKNETLMLFGYIPHFLFKGRINISTAEIIEV